MPTREQLQALFDQASPVTPSTRPGRADQLRTLFEQADPNRVVEPAPAAEEQSEVPQSKLAFRIPKKSLERYKRQVDAMPEGEEKKFHAGNYQNMSMYMDDLVKMENRAARRGLSPEDQRIADELDKQNRGGIGVVGGSGATTIAGTTGERGFARGAAKIGITMQNMALRTMGALGVNGASEAADNNNRIVDLMGRLDAATDRESELAKYTSPEVARGVSAISEMVPSLVAGGGGARSLGFGGKLAETKALATLYAASGWDQSLTTAKDLGLSPKGQNAYAAGMGALEAGIMLTFGRAANALGFQTTEQVFFPAAKRAAQKLLTKAGVVDALKSTTKGMTSEAAEEGLTQFAQQLWGSYAGVNSLEDIGKNTMEAALLGAATRGVFGGVQGLQSKLASAMTKAPEYLKAATDADSFIRSNPPEAVTAELSKTPEQLDMSPEAAEAYQDEIRAQVEPVAEVEVDAPAPGPSVAPAPGPAAVSAPVAPPVGPPSGPAAVSAPGPAAVSAPVAPPVGPAAPAIVAPPTEPPQAIPPQAGAGEPQPSGFTSARRVDIAADRKLLGLDELSSPTRRSWQSALETAQSRGLDQESVSADLASQIIESPRSLDDVETAGLTLARADLKKRYADLSQQAAQEGADVTAIGAVQNRIQAQYDLLSQAQAYSGTEKGRALASQKLTVGMDTDIVSVRGRARAAKKAPLTDAENQAFQSNVEALNSKEIELQAAQQKQLGEAAEAILVKAAERMPKQDIADLYNRLSTLLGNGCDTQ